MLNLKHLLSFKAKNFYIDQKDIEIKNPLYNDGKDIHHIYEAAQILVSERHEKGDLIDLVNALLCIIDDIRKPFK